MYNFLYKSRAIVRLCSIGLLSNNSGHKAVSLKKFRFDILTVHCISIKAHFQRRHLPSNVLGTQDHFKSSSVKHVKLNIQSQ